jgi:hypothetical protein
MKRELGICIQRLSAHELERDYFRDFQDGGLHRWFQPLGHSESVRERWK